MLLIIPGLVWSGFIHETDWHGSNICVSDRQVGFLISFVITFEKIGV